MLTKEEGFTFPIFLSSVFQETVFWGWTADSILWFCFVFFFQWLHFLEVIISTGCILLGWYHVGCRTHPLARLFFLCVPLSEWDPIMIFYLKYSEEQTRRETYVMAALQWPCCSIHNTEFPREGWELKVCSQLWDNVLVRLGSQGCLYILYIFSQAIIVMLGRLPLFCILSLLCEQNTSQC